MSDDDLLMCLRIKGFGKADSIAEALGVSSDDARGRLAGLVETRLAEETRVGHRLSPAGRERADQAFASERAGVDQAVIADAYEKFNPINDAFKQLVTRWQMRTIDGKQIRNDHTDEAYDKGLLSELDCVHHDVCELVETVASLCPRLGTYHTRLGAALTKLESGDLRYITAPDRDSYHTVWFELHQDLIGLSGTTRQKEAAAGRAS